MEASERAAVPRVEVITLEGFKVLVGGEPIRFAGRGQRKPLELLKVLVALGGDSVPSTQLCDILWPDADGDAAYNTLTITLHRLRKLIGADALHHQDGRVSLSREQCRVDCLEFSEQAALAERLLSGHPRDTLWAHVQQVFRLYRRPFLDGEYEPPEILTSRQRLHDLFLRTVEHTARWYADQGDDPQAMLLYRMGLDTDGQVEPFYRELMHCHLRRSEVSDGLAVYERCRQALAAAGDIAPSSGTESVRKALQELPRPEPEPAAPATQPPVQEATAAAGTTPYQALPAERRQATVLHAVLSETAGEADPDVDPEAMAESQDRTQLEATRTVEAHGGVMNQLLADGFVAVFGVPSAHEDDPVRAVRAALALRDRLRVSAVDGDGPSDADWQIGIGIETGTVVTSTSTAREGVHGIKGTPLTEAARLAHRVEDGVWVGPRLRGLVADRFTLRDGDHIAHGWHVEAEAPHGTRFEAAAQRGYTRFTGRERELTSLHDHLSQATRGAGQVVSVTGEAGMGKSRVVFEFVRGLDPGRYAVIPGRCQSYGESSPYLPFLNALRRGLRLDEAATRDALHDRIVESVTAVHADLRRFLPHYLHLLSVPSDHYALPPSLEGELLRRELEESLTAILLLTAQRQPTVLILEDWHWADPASDAMLTNLTGIVADHPLLLLVVFRPEYERRWPDRTNHAAVTIPALDEAQTGAMLCAMLGVDALPEGLATAVHGRTGGNPLFNEELAQTLLADGTVEVADGAARLAQPLDSARLPDTIQAVIRARVDRLESADREVLRLASVIGRDFERDVLERIADSRETVTGALERMAQSDLVHRVRVVPLAEYRFKHVLTQEVVYETLLQAQRKRLHGAVGEATEALHAERLDERYEVLARHYSLSDAADKAVHYLMLAGDKAFGTYTVPQAFQHYGAAIAILDTATDSNDGKRRRIDASLHMAQQIQWLPSPEYLQILEQSVEFARELADDPRLAAALFSSGFAFWVIGELFQGQDRLREAIEVAERVGDRRILAMAQANYGFTLVYPTRLRESLTYFDTAIRGFDELNNTRDFLMNCTNMAFPLMLLGEFESAHRTCQRAFEIAERNGQTTMIGLIQFWDSVTYVVEGDWPTAIREVSRAVQTNLERGDLFIASYCRGNLGGAQFRNGDIRSGLENLTQAISTLEQLGARAAMHYLHGMAAESYALIGDAESARHHFEKGLALVPFGQIYGEDFNRRGWATVLAASDDPDWPAVFTELDRSLALSEEGGLRPYLAATHVRYAECLHKKGDLDAAREHLDQAQALFREMNMVWWLEQAQTVRGRIDRGEPFRWFVPFVDGPPKLDS